MRAMMTAAPRKLCAALLVLYVALLWLLRPRIAELCSGHLVEVPEVAGWRALPEISPRDDGLSLGPFKTHGHSTMPKYNGLGFADAELYDPQLCRSSGVSLAAWFERGPAPDYERAPLELRLRQAANGVFVVSAGTGSDPTPEQQNFVIAVRRASGVWLSLTTPEAPWLAVLLSIGAAGVIAGASRPQYSRVGLRVGLACLSCVGVVCAWAFLAEALPSSLS